MLQSLALWQRGQHPTPHPKFCDVKIPKIFLLENFQVKLQDFRILENPHLGKFTGKIGKFWEHQLPEFAAELCLLEFRWKFTLCLLENCIFLPLSTFFNPQCHW